jgi:hypothetical protein
VNISTQRSREAISKERSKRIPIRASQHNVGMAGCGVKLTLSQSACGLMRTSRNGLATCKNRVCHEVVADWLLVERVEEQPRCHHSYARDGPSE